MVGCALSVMQTFEHACCSGFSKNCLVENQLGGLKNRIIYLFCDVNNFLGHVQQSFHGSTDQVMVS